MLKSIARRAFLPLAFTAFVSLGAVADDGGKSAGLTEKSTYKP